MPRGASADRAASRQPRWQSCRSASDLRRAPEPEIFVPYAQHPVMNTMFLATRASGQPSEIAEAIRAAVRQTSRSAVLEDVQPLSALVARSVAPH